MALRKGSSGVIHLTHHEVSDKPRLLTPTMRIVRPSKRPTPRSDTTAPPLDGKARGGLARPCRAIKCASQFRLFWPPGFSCFLEADPTATRTL